MIRSLLGLLLILSFSTAYAAKTAKAAKSKKTTKAASTIKPTTLSSPTHAEKEATTQAAPPSYSSNSAAYSRTSGYMTEFFYQAPENQSALISKISYANSQAKFKKNNEKYNQDGLYFALGYQYGFAPTLAYGVTVNYESATAKTKNDAGKDKTTESNGLEDLEFYLNGYSILNEGIQIWYGLILSISPGDSEVKDISANKTKENAYSGGNKLEPHIGFSKKWSDWIVGAKFSTELRLGEATEKYTNTSGTSRKFKSTGGERTALQLFAETPTSSGTVGMFIAFGSWKTTNLESEGTTGTLEGTNTAVLSAYAVQKISDECELGGQLVYTQIVNDVSTAGGLKSNSGVGATLAARFIF